MVKAAFVREVKNAWFLRKKSKFIETKRGFISDLGYMPVGLWLDLIQYCKDNNVQCEFTPNAAAYINQFTELKKEDVFDYVNDLFEGAKKDGKDFKPRQYQIEAVYTLLKYKRSTAEISTSAGKTLIAYILFKYLIEKLNYKKILYIVPNVDLAKQPVEKFNEYESYLLPEKQNNTWTTGILKSALNKK